MCRLVTLCTSFLVPYVQPYRIGHEYHSSGRIHCLYHVKVPRRGVLERLGWNTWRGVEYRFFALPEDSYVWARSLGNLG